MGTDEHRYQKQYKLSNGTIADAVLFASEPLRMICIDSKFPLENYNRLMSADTAQEKARAHAQFCTGCEKAYPRNRFQVYTAAGNSGICLHVSACRSSVFLYLCEL